MRFFLVFSVCALLAAGCGKGKSDVADTAPDAPSGVALNVKAPDPLPVPPRKTPASPEDWQTIANNKESEVIETINLINPVAVYLQEGFKQYGSRFSPRLHEEWVDTQAQLTKAMNTYDAAKARKAEGKYDKQLFLSMEGAWQDLVKTGVAGMLTKSMMDAELQRLSN